MSIAFLEHPVSSALPRFFWCNHGAGAPRPAGERGEIGHLDAYLDELEWRFNNRNNPYLFRDTLLKLIQAENLPYQELVQSPLE